MKFAIKRLTRSDLTFFESHFRVIEAGNQKAINLNKNVFEAVLFPDIEAAALAFDRQIPVTVDIFGPDSKPLYRVARHVTKRAAYKNWRLNGAAVPDPDDDAGRFDQLAERDVLVMGFEGDATPTRVVLVLVRAAEGALYERLLEEVGGPTVPRAMRVVSLERLAELSDVAPESHPLRLLAPDTALAEDIEDAAVGGAVGTKRLRVRTRTGRLPRKISYADLAKVRVNIDAIGRDGEELVYAMLKDELAAGAIKAFEWFADGDAYGPYDFKITMLDDAVDLVDVKTTTTRFKQVFHLSLSETEEAAASETPYRIYRVYEVGAEGALLRRSEDMRELAKALLAGSADLPPGVFVDSFSIDPEVLEWADPERLVRADEEED